MAFNWQQYANQFKFIRQLCVGLRKPNGQSTKEIASGAWWTRFEALLMVSTTFCPISARKPKKHLTREIEKFGEDIRSLEMVQAVTFDHHQELAEAASMRPKSLNSISRSARYTIAPRSTAGSYRRLPNRTRPKNEGELASSEKP